MTATVEQDPRVLEIESFIAQATEARREYVDFAKVYREKAHREALLEAERPVILEQVKTELMANSAGLAATNAEKLARIHSTYLAHLASQRDTVREKDDARTQMVSATIRANTAIAAIKALAGFLA